MEDFLAEYSGMLKSGLSRNDKATINTLSMLAEDNKQFSAGIVRAIEQHILACPPPSKLPALYLVDSIIKNVGEPYKATFSQRLPEVFGAVWDTTLADKRSSLSRLYGTWVGVLAPDVLARVQQRMSSSNGRAAAAGAQQQQQQQAPMLAAQQQAAALQAQLAAQHQAAALGFAGGMQLLQPQQPQQPQAYHLLGLPPQPTTYVQVGSSLVPVAALPQQHAPVALPGLLQPAAGLPPPPHIAGGTPQHVMQVAGLPPVSPAHPGWPQQQGGGPLPMARRSPASPAAAHASPLRGGGPAPPQQAPGRTPGRSASPLPASTELSKEALSSLLSNLAKTGVLAPSGGGGSKEDDAALKATTFSAAFIKELHPGVLVALRQVSARTRPKFRDLAFQRNKRRAAATSVASRSWYLGVDTWIAGTAAAAGEAVAANPFEDEPAAAGGAAGAGGAAPAVVPEDPAQPECAISGEPFEKFFDQDAEAWFYRGAVRIAGDEAARYGVPDGSLVKVTALAEAGLGSGAAGMLAAAAAGGDGGGDEAELAAAAAAAPAAGGAAQPAASSLAAAAAAAAAAGGGMDADMQQPGDQDPAEHKAALLAAVKVEQQAGEQQQLPELKPLPKHEHKAEPEAAPPPAAGAKREAGSDGADDGCAAKKPRVDAS